MKPAQLGRMKKVDLQDVWANEASDFTPWLAEEDNLELLGDTIGMELESQEKDVGPFRADILCKDTATGDWVVIENQLAKTDHTHLGQLLTYAAGLKAVTIVWIAQEFHEEHRAALDWLNEITDSRFNFFGLEVELWRIGDSDIAPKFNVACKPNDWTKPPPSGLTDTQKAQLEFWGDLKEVMLAQEGPAKPAKPQPGSWVQFAVGRANFCIMASMNTQKNWLSVALCCSGEDAKAHFHLLHQQTDEIEAEIKSGLDWTELPDKKSSYITTRLPEIDPLDRAKWPEHHEWLAQMIAAFHEAFSPRVKVLDAGDYQPEGALQEEAQSQ